MSQQVCVHYPHSEFLWHHRVVMVASAEGKWVVLTPDHDLEFVTLTDVTVVPLVRSAPLLARVAGDFYDFDPIPLRDLERLRVEARRWRGLSASSAQQDRVGPPCRDGWSRTQHTNDSANCSRPRAW